MNQPLDAMPSWLLVHFTKEENDPPPPRGRSVNQVGMVSLVFSGWSVVITSQKSNSDSGPQESRQARGKWLFKKSYCGPGEMAQ